MPTPGRQIQCDFLDDTPSECSMDMDNDPRFTQPTVLDKRLFAFTAQVGFVGGMTSSCSLGQCFNFKRHLYFGYCFPVPAFKVVQSFMQVISFFGMSLVLVMSLYATLVSVNQAYFGNRLMTAGSNGFEMARSFYMNPQMTAMRHRAVRFLARALILLLLSSGGMLYVKFAEDQDVESGYELYDGAFAMMPTTPTSTTSSFPGQIVTKQVSSKLVSTTAPYLITGPRAFNLICDSHMHPAGIITLVVFSCTAIWLWRFIQVPSENLFSNIYSMRYEHEESMKALLGAKRSRIAEMDRSVARSENEALKARRFSQRFSNVDIDDENKCCCM